MKIPFIFSTKTFVYQKKDIDKSKIIESFYFYVINRPVFIDSFEVMKNMNKLIIRTSTKNELKLLKTKK
jgi:hypothetical protein